MSKSSCGLGNALRVKAQIQTLIFLKGLAPTFKEPGPIPQRYSLFCRSRYWESQVPLLPQLRWL